MVSVDEYIRSSDSSSFPIVWLFFREIPKYCITEKHKLSCHEFIVITLICFGLIYSLSYVTQLVISLLYALTDTSSHYTLPTSFPIINITSNLLFGVIIVPIFEGLFFRKLIISRLIILGERFAIVISAMLFSLFHTNIFQFVSSYIIGLILSYVYLKTGQIKQSIFLHSILNLFSFVIAPFLLTLEDIGTPILLLWIVSSMIASITLLVMNRKKINIDYGIGIIRESQKISMFLRTPGFICYLILCLSISLAYVFEFI